MIPCQFLEWDTAFFGARIGRITVSQLDADLLYDIEMWVQSRQIDCLYFLADADHAETVRLVEMHNYQLQDIRTTFERELNTPMDSLSSDDKVVLRHYQPGDLEILDATARTAYLHSRFYNDPGFSNAQASQLYETWLYNSCEKGYADAVVIAELGGRAAAYVTCHLNQESQTGSIGLVGVTEAARGQKLGLRLVNFALLWFQQQSMKQVTVVTQGRNIAAQRLYQRCGFLTQSIQLWYHKWYNEAAG